MWEDYDTGALVKSSTVWGEEFPEERGWYWCYGNFTKRVFDTDQEWKSRFRLVPVEVRKASNGFVYISMGNFLYQEDWQGFWTKMDVPPAPTGLV